MKLPLKILIHSIFWTVFVMFTMAMSLARSNISEFPAMPDITPHLVVNFVWAAVIFYLFYLHFITYFEKRQFVWYLIYSIILSIALSCIFLLTHWLINKHFNIFSYRVFAPPMVGTFILAQCGSLVRGFENWFTNIKLKVELENRNLKNELELLKSQINPHFLFNTLNNIDSFIQTSPQEASRSLITLSNMLRYMIYDTKSDLVPLTKEIEYVHNFIQLQHIRYKNPDYIKVSIPDNCSGVLVAPMLFIPFIENAFKYSFNAGELPVISIDLQCSKDNLQFNCRNYFNSDPSLQERTGGVGLENVKRRLKLLYPGKYQLAISKENHIFNVNLSIHLA